MTDRLTCEACGCVSRGEADGWTAFLRDHTEGIEPLAVGIFCPRCAALQFDHWPEHGADYTGNVAREAVSLRTGQTASRPEPRRSAKRQARRP